MGTVLKKAAPDAPSPQGPFLPGYQATPFDPQIEAMQARLDAPAAPMFTPEQMEQRKRQNDLHYQLGLLGQLSGDEGLQHVGGQIFKQALAQRQPQMSEKGSLDPLTGQWSYNPEYQREQQLGRMQQLQNLRSQHLAQVAAREDQQVFQREAAADRAANQMALHQLTAAAAGGRRSEAQEARAFTQEGQLRGQFDKMTESLRGELDQIGKLKTVIGGYEGRTMDPAAQSSVVILLNKFQDEGSVVREAEFDRIVKAQGLEAQAKMLVDRIAKGHILSPQMIQQINYLGSLYEQAATAKIQKHAANYSTVAQRYGLNPQNVIIDPQWHPAPTKPAAPIDVSQRLQPKAPAPAAPTVPQPVGSTRSGSW